MTIKIDPSTTWPYVVAVMHEDMFGTHNSIDSVSDWCDRLIGNIDQDWNIRWDNSQGWLWCFRKREDASFFNFVWSE